MNERPETVAPGRISHVLTAVTLAVASAVTVVAFDVHELLYAPAVDGLSRVDVPLRIDSIAVQERELACLMPWLTDTADDRICVGARAQHRMQDLVAPVDLEHVGLEGVVGEPQVPCRAGSAEACGSADAERLTRPWQDVDDALQIAHLVEHLDAIVGTIAHVDQVVVAPDHAVGMPAVARGEEPARIGLRIVDHAGDATPLPQVLSGRAEHDDTMIAVAIGDVNAAALARLRVRIRVNPYVGGLIQQCRALVRIGIGARIAALVAV